MTGDSGTPFVSGLTPNGRLLVLGHPLAEGLLDPARRLGAGNRRHRVRGAVVADALSVARPGLEDDVLDELPCSTSNPGTWYYRVRGLNQTQLKQAADGLVDADQAHGREAELPASLRK